MIPHRLAMMDLPHRHPKSPRQIRPTTPLHAKLNVARLNTGEPIVKLRSLLLLVTASVLPAFAADPSNVTRSTLSNGLQVVIVRNALAPVVTVELNFKVGGDETPPGFPGMRPR